MPKLVPFDPEQHTPKDIGLGGPSTEYLITVDSPDGKVMVVPSIWWDEKGEPAFIGDLNEDKIYVEDIIKIAQDYEKETGLSFPRFGEAGNPDNYKLADTWAMKRSKAGGASEVPLPYSFTDLELDADLFKGSF